MDRKSGKCFLDMSGGSLIRREEKWTECSGLVQWQLQYKLVVPSSRSLEAVKSHICCFENQHVRFSDCTFFCPLAIVYPGGYWNIPTEHLHCYINNTVVFEGLFLCSSDFSCAQMLNVSDCLQLGATVKFPVMFNCINHVKKSLLSIFC